MVAGEGDAVGRHPVLGIGEGGGEIGRTRAHGAVDAGLEGVALAAAQPLREAPVGAAAGEREACHRVRRQAIVEAGGEAGGARGKIVAAEPRGRRCRGCAPPKPPPHALQRCAKPGGGASVTGAFIALA